MCDFYYTAIVRVLRALLYYGIWLVFQFDIIYIFFSFSLSTDIVFIVRQKRVAVPRENLFDSYFKFEGVNLMLPPLACESLHKICCLIFVCAFIHDHVK